MKSSSARPPFLVLIVVGKEVCYLVYESTTIVIVMSGCAWPHSLGSFAMSRHPDVEILTRHLARWRGLANNTNYTITSILYRRNTFRI